MFKAIRRILSLYKIDFWWARNWIAGYMERELSTIPFSRPPVVLLGQCNLNPFGQLKFQLHSCIWVKYILAYRSGCCVKELWISNCYSIFCSSAPVKSSVSSAISCNRDSFSSSEWKNLFLACTCHVYKENLNVDTVQIISTMTLVLR